MLYSVVGNRVYCKTSKNWDMVSNYNNCSKLGTLWSYNVGMCPKDADGMANSVDPDQTAPLGAV